MFKFLKSLWSRKNLSINPKWTIFADTPIRHDLPLVRRWSVIGNTGPFDYQYNVYRLEKGFLLTKQGKDGSEVESDLLFKGGYCDSLSTAFERAVSPISDLIIASGSMGGPFQKAIFFDTTPSCENVQLSTIEYAGGQQANETKFHNIETKEPYLATHLNNLPKHTIENVSKMMDVAIYRMDDCPLMAVLLKIAESRPSDFEGQKLRYLIFTLWALRRAIYAQCDRPYLQSLVKCYDSQVEDLLNNFSETNGNIVDLASEAFGIFDGCLDNKQQPGPMYWLGKSALGFIVNNSYDDQALAGLDFTWTLLPSQVMLEVVDRSKPYLSKM